MTKKNRLYILSGLGVDSRVFRKMDLSSWEIVHIEWIAPLEGESISQYAARLSASIADPNPVLLGLSFGGMVATEIAKQRPKAFIIQIASALTRYDLPVLYRLTGKLYLYKILPARWLKWSNPVTEWFFGAKSREDKSLLKEILQDTDTLFLKWAIKEIACWNNRTEPALYFRIHGEKDKIIPVKKMAGYQMIIKNAGHFITISHASEVSKILKDLLPSYAPEPEI